MGATRTSCMIMFILAGAAFLTKTMAFTGIPRELAEWVDAHAPVALRADRRADAWSTWCSAPRSTASR